MREQDAVHYFPPREKNMEKNNWDGKYPMYVSKYNATFNIKTAIQSGRQTHWSVLSNCVGVACVFVRARVCFVIRLSLFTSQVKCSNSVGTSCI